MHWKVFTFLFLFAALFADEKRVLGDPHVHFATEGEPGYKICDVVSAITGHVVHQDDLIIPGVEPIRIPRLYISGDCKTNEFSGWTFFPHVKLYKVQKVNEQAKYYVPEPSGAIVKYTKVKKHTYKINMEKHGFAITNTAGPYISARSNLANNVLIKTKKKWVSVYTADGIERAYERKYHTREGSRYYSTYLLQWERLPNGNYIQYGHDSDHRINRIVTTNSTHKKTYAWANISYFGEKNFKMETSDGRVLHFYFGKRGNTYFLERIEKNFAFTEKFSYSNKKQHPNPYLSQITLPLNRFWQAEYYQTGSNDVNGTHVNIDDHNFRRRRVKMLYAPVGTDNSPVQTHTFLYNDNKKAKRGFEWPCVTHIYDVYGRHTEVISTTGMRPESTIWYTDKDKPYCFEKTVWQGHLLKLKTFCDGQGKPLYQRAFTYDDRGNVLEERIFQTEDDCLVTKYQYNDQNFMIKKEEASGLVTLFSYLGNTGLLCARITTDNHKITIREFFEYNADNILIRSMKEADGRKWIRHVELAPHGLPAAIEERYIEEGKEKLLKRQEFIYSPQLKVTEERVFDAEGRLAYTLYKKYNLMGQVTEETDALGQVTHHIYDELGNETTTLEPSGLRKDMVYDYANRLIQITESGSHEKRSTYFQYDLKNRKIASTDSFGNTTRFTYDPFDHQVAIHYSDGTHEETAYDCMGRKISTTDGCGHTTFYRYDFQGKPLEIHHSDGTVETFAYDVSGRLLVSTNAQGVQTRYTYDALSRPLSKATYSPSGEKLAEESWVYDSLNLLTKTDAAGYVTTYQYDGAGRKIAEDETTFAYDKLGRLYQTTCENRTTTTQYDLLNRPIAEYIGDLFCTKYTYDAADNQTAVIRAGGAEITLYDVLKRPIQIVDAKGSTTYIEYEDTAPSRKKITAPNGVQTIETFDARGRLALQEKVSPLGKLLSREAYTYDGNGNLTLQESSVIYQGKIEDTISTAWEYGPEKRLLSLTEELGTKNQRATRYTYTLTGQKETLTKPSGITLHYAYDFLGRLIELVSSDGTCHYQYYYSALHSPIQIDDIVQHTSTYRAYDHKNRLIREQLGNGLCLQWTYDALGRKTSLTLPDHSCIRYLYDAIYLRRIERYDPTGKFLYGHNYNSYDLSGNLLEEQLISNLGAVSFSLDATGTPKAVSSPYHTESQTRSPSSQVIEWTKDGQSAHFAYDDLGQLIQEEGCRYAYDSLGHRRPSNETYNQGYTFDALDRLTSVNQKDQHITFSYDAFHRRLTKTTNGQTLRFLYDIQDEIGTINSEGHLTELRVLGIGKGAEIGAAISMELQGNLYVPIHDLQGNLFKLISLPDKKVAFTYNYTAFGEPKSPLCTFGPWRFASKRIDDETGLVFYGRRYYNPTTGSWLTPDPEGFDDSVNLYLFVHNDPLSRPDLYGLWDMGPNYVRFSFEECGAGLRAAQFGAGYVLAAIGHYLVPNFLGGNTIAGLGNTIAGSGQYKSPQPYTHQIAGSSAHNDVHGTHINGINTSFAEAKQNATRFSQHFGDIPVTLVYNPSQGIVSDLIECVLNHLGVRTAAVDLLSRTWRQILSEFQRINVHGTIPHSAHSQGGIITKLALEMLSPEERKHIHAYTFGSGSLFSSRWAGHVEHHVSVRDGVPYASSFRYGKALLRQMRGKDSNVRFIGSWWGVPFIDHGMAGATYGGALEKAGYEFAGTIP